MVKFNFLKKDKKPDTAEVKNNIKENKSEVKLEKKPVEKKEKLSSTSGKKEYSNLGWKVLKSPQITEKATFLAEKNQYVFKISSEANKTEVKKAVEGIYKVDVSAVKIIKIPAKKRKVGKVSGWKKGYKKAIVKIKSGQKIELLPR